MPSHFWFKTFWLAVTHVWNSRYRTKLEGCALTASCMSPCTHHLLQTTDTNLNHVVCLFALISLFYAYKRHNDTPNQGTKDDSMTNNHCHNLKGGTIWDLLVIKWLHSKACESGLNHLWQHYGKFTIHDKLKNYDLGRNRNTDTHTMKHDTTPNLTIITLWLEWLSGMSACGG